MENIQISPEDALDNYQEFISNPSTNPVTYPDDVPEDISGRALLQIQPSVETTAKIIGPVEDLNPPHWRKGLSAARDQEVTEEEYQNYLMNLYEAFPMLNPEEDAVLQDDLADTYNGPTAEDGNIYRRIGPGMTLPSEIIRFTDWPVRYLKTSWDEPFHIMPDTDLSDDLYFVDDLEEFAWYKETPTGQVSRIGDSMASPSNHSPESDEEKAWKIAVQNQSVARRPRNGDILDEQATDFAIIREELSNGGLSNYIDLKEQKEIPGFGTQSMFRIQNGGEPALEELYWSLDGYDPLESAP